MNNSALELFLLMVNLAQLKEKDLIIRLYIESINSIFEKIIFKWLEQTDNSTGNFIEVCTRKKIHGIIGYTNGDSYNKNILNLIQNSASLLGIIIEQIEHENEILIQRNNLQKLFDEKTKELKESESKYRTLVEKMQDGLMVVDNNDKILFVNPQMCEMLGYCEEELIGKIGYETLLVPEDKKFIEEKNENRLKKISETYEILMKKKSGEEILLRLNASPIEDENSNVIGSFATCIDITESKQSLEALKKSEEELRKMNSEKDKFFSIIAHDLRSPFTGLLGLTSIMKDASCDMSVEYMQNLAGKINKSATNLFELLNNLLEWSTMKRGLTDYYPEKINILNMVENILEIHKENIKYKNINPVVDIEKEIIAYGDFRLLETVLRNLISNAIKFSMRNSDIYLSAIAGKDNLITISVIDNGIGMDEELVQNIFHLDYNSKRLGTENELSTGLGLLLCKECVTKNEGIIWVESEKNKGSKFHFTIPKFQ